MRMGVLFSLFMLLCNIVWGVGGDMGVETQPFTNGSEEYPYLIEDFSDFQIFRTTTSYWATGIYTKLMCDIDLNPALEGRKVYIRAVIAKDTIDNSGFQGTDFRGIFDGNGYAVKNLVIDTGGDNKDYLGLFGQINSSGKVKNLGIENVDIVESSTVNVSRYFGGLCGANFGVITNCYATGSISGIYSIGGLCGRNSEGVISNCYANCTVTGYANLGGLCGVNINIGVIEDCYAKGFVVGEDYCVELGGLCGINAQGTYAPGYIENSYADVTVTAGENSSSLGGLCGTNSGGISDCYSLGSVTAGRNSNNVGGLCGFVDNSIYKCYAATLVTVGSGFSSIGGFCGEENGGNISSCFWDMEVSGMAIGIGYQNPTPEDVIGKTTAQMQMQSTFLDAGWEFADFEVGLRGWYMPENDYPQFDWRNSNASFVPDVTNMILSEAHTGLTEAGLTVGEDVYVKSWKTSENTITGISVHAGSYVDKSIPIKIFVSSGSSGNGSESDPYEIAGMADLYAINDNLSAHYIMTTDIYFSSANFHTAAVIAPATSVYSNPFIGIPFSGTFNGNNHIISNLRISSTEVSHVGLFGYIDQNGSVRNLGIKNSNVGVYNNHFFAAILCGKNDGNIRNCYITDSLLSRGGGSLGGLCGENGGNIEYCYVKDMTIEIYQSNSIGLLCGKNNEGGLKDCYSMGVIVDNRSSAGIGGLCGALFGGNVINCYSTGIVEIDNNTIYLGGLCGYLKDGNFANCFWDSEVSALVKGIGNLDDDPNGIIGKTTAEMQIQDTFTATGWDFVDESTNGTDDIWRMCVYGVEYPHLSWEYAQNGDFACGDGTDIYDLHVLAEHWLLTVTLDPTAFSYACDANGDGVVDLIDFSVLGINW